MQLAAQTPGLNHVITALEQFNRFDKVWDSFNEIHSYYYQLGAFTLCLSFAEGSLAKKILPALKHLEVAPVMEPDFTIGLWDISVHPQSLPKVDWQLLSCNGYQGICEGSVYLHYYNSIKALTALNVSKNRGYYVVRSANDLPWWVSGSPLQVILNVWLQARELQLTHTAAVGNDQNAVLLMGKGGSGKSTTTLACLAEGMNYLGEDYCLLASKPSPMVYSVYQSAKWESNTRTLFPSYEKFIQNPESAKTEKALVYYQDIFPVQIKKMPAYKGRYFVDSWGCTITSVAEIDGDMCPEEFNAKYGYAIALFGCAINSYFT